jgi:hypothetical protein
VVHRANCTVCGDVVIRVDESSPHVAGPQTVLATSAPTRGGVRVARAAAFGVAALTIAAGAHVAAGGVLPSVTVLALLAVPVTVVAVALTGRRCGPGLLVGSMAAAQILLHETLVALTTQVPGDLAGQMSAASASAMGGHAMAHTDGRSVTMTAAHVVATLVTALLLARGEQALWQLVSRLLPTLPCLPRLLLACGPRPARVLLSVPALRPSLVSGGSGLRGPPARLIAAV